MAVVSEKKSEQILVKILPSTMAEVARIAEIEDRHLGYVARELMIRGLALYRADGRLKDEAKPERHLAPVVAHIGGGEREPTKAEVRRMINSDEIAEIERRVTPQRTQRIPQLKQKAR